MNEGISDRSDERGQAEPSFISRLPSFPGESGEAAGGSELICDECEQASPDAASYSVLHIFFLFVFVVWRIDSVFKCPTCMRAYLLQRLPLSLLLATVLAPLILVWWGVLFLRTLGR